MKRDTILTSIDWAQSNDFEQVSSVIGELNFVKSATFYSDKFTTKDLEKMDLDYRRDLAKSRFTTKVKVSKYIK